MSETLSREWIAAAMADMEGRPERELEALVAVSSPSGDPQGAEEAIAVATALLPAAAEIERVDCSTPGYAPDLLARLTGTGSRRLVLVGHLDTVVAHADHRPLQRDGDRLVGSGAIDMKGGVALAVGVIRALASAPAAFAELALLLVNDEEWRVGGFAHAARFAGYDACLCFEGGERGPGGEEGVVVRRKAAGTLRVRAKGVAAHSGSAPERGRNALLALTAAAERVAAAHDPGGPQELTAVPTVLHSGDAFNVVPAAGELVCDLRADELSAFEPVLAAVPPSGDGLEIEAELVRRWPGMDTREATADLLGQTSTLLGRPVVAAARGGASDASHIAAHVPLTVDGLGLLGSGAHTPDEFVHAASVRPRAELALAMSVAALCG